jgi:hypothetical protein
MCLKGLRQTTKKLVYDIWFPEDRDLNAASSEYKADHVSQLSGVCVRNTPPQTFQSVMVSRQVRTIRSKLWAALIIVRIICTIGNPCSKIHGLNTSSNLYAYKSVCRK